MVVDRTAALVSLGELQARSMQALIAAYGGGQPDYERIGDYLPLGRQFLAETEAYEECWPGSFQVNTVAGPLVQSLSMYADWLESSGDRDKATALRQESDGIATRLLNADQQAGHLRTRAMEAAAVGRFQDALIGLEHAQQEFLREGRRIEAAQTLLQLANVYEWLGDYARAMSTMDAAQSLVAEQLAGGPPSSSAVAASITEQLATVAEGGTGLERVGEDALGLQRLHFELVQGRARVSRRLGRYDEARALFEQARPFVEEFTPAGVDFHLAAIAIETGNLDDAARLLQRVAPDFDNGLLRPRRGALRQLQSDLALGQGDLSGALASADAGVAEQDAYPDLELAWKLQWRRGRALARLGREGEALKAYREAARTADTVRLAPLGYVLDTAFVADKIPMFNEAIDLAVTAGDGIAVAELIELVKARALAAVLSRPADPQQAHDPDAARFDALSEELDALSFAMYAGSATTDQVRRRGALLVERREVLERIRVRDPRWRGLSVPPAVDAAATCRQLASGNRAALVLHLRGRRLVAVLLTGDDIVVGEKSWDESTVSAIQTYAENLTLAQPDHFLADLSGECDVDLHDVLPDAVAEALEAVRILLVVPHGILHLLPWATMTLGGQRLFTTHAVGVLPNLAALAQTDVELPVPQAVGLLGDPDYTGLTRYKPLPQAGAELADLEHLYGDGLVAPVARQADATQDALAHLLPQGRPGSVLHLVCHADVAADEPLSSGLILTGSTLDAGEILQLGCGFPEVVLSACSTGWRPQTPHGLDLAGDDAIGLVASFLEAGACSLVVSITQAKDDIARQFMVTWHKYRRAGDGPLEALRRTQMSLHDADVPIWAWAGITAYGSDGTVTA